MGGDNINTLYAIYDNDEIIAISEYEIYITEFLLLIKTPNKKSYSIMTIDSENKYNKFLSKYNDLLLQEYEGIVIREKEYYIFKNIIDESYHEINNTIDTLYDINIGCIMSPKDHDKLNDAINVLLKHTKKKRINDFLNIKEFIRKYYNTSPMQEQFEYQQIVMNNIN